jgi:hypothetical protein
MMRNLLAVSVLIGLALIIIAGGIIAVILGQEWIPIVYFGSGLAIALSLFFGQLLIESYLDSEMLWIFPCCVIFGTIVLFFVICWYFYYMATASIDPATEDY